MSGLLQRAAACARSLLYPPRCLLCGGLVGDVAGLCADCWREAPFISGLACRTCGTPLPGDSDRDECCDGCLSTARPWTRGVAALAYAGAGRKLALLLKHADRHDIAPPAGRWMAARAQGLVAPDTVIVPVPLHPRRRLRRRYNQSALLAQALAVALDRPWLPAALIRPRATPCLDGLDREARFDALSGAIAAHPRHGGGLEDRPVLLVDDVMTSGATLAAAAEACARARCGEICVAVLARVGRQA